MVVVPAGRVVEAGRLGVGLQREERGPGLPRGLCVELGDVRQTVGVVVEHHRVRVDVRLERAGGYGLLSEAGPASAGGGA